MDNEQLNSLKAIKRNWHWNVSISHIRFLILSVITAFVNSFSAIKNSIRNIFFFSNPFLFQIVFNILNNVKIDFITKNTLRKKIIKLFLGILDLLYLHKYFEIYLDSLKFKRHSSNHMLSSNLNSPIFIYIGLHYQNDYFIIISIPSCISSKKI